MLGLVADRTQVEDHGEIMFTNYGQKAGSLVSITVVRSGPPTDPFGTYGNRTTGAPRGEAHIVHKDLPKLIQPYDTVTLKVGIRILSEKPLGELFKELKEEEKRFEFLYTTTTRKGQQIRTGYLHVDLPTEEGIL